MEFWSSSSLSMSFSYIKVSVHLCVGSSQVFHSCSALWKLSDEVKLQGLWFHVYYVFCPLNLSQHIQEIATAHCYPKWLNGRQKPLNYLQYINVGVIFTTLNQPSKVSLEICTISHWTVQKNNNISQYSKKKTNVLWLLCTVRGKIEKVFCYLW